MKQIFQASGHLLAVGQRLGTERAKRAAAAQVHHQVHVPIALLQPLLLGVVHRPDRARDQPFDPPFERLGLALQLTTGGLHQVVKVPP
jgi:hypothetical protein